MYNEQNSLTSRHKITLVMALKSTNESILNNRFLYIHMLP